MMTTNINSMQAHQTLMNINANNIANVNTQDFNASQGNINDNLEVSSTNTNNPTSLTKEIPNQIVIEDGFEAQTVAIKTQDEMDGSVLDLKA
ncbi:MAG: flagellar biosynthesis protein FlgE [Epsilonproteobacteria bacterium]|nr:flagellar biosynthesis protein FlgE [Campylobacterota bacterium]